MVVLAPLALDYLSQKRGKKEGAACRYIGNGDETESNLNTALI